MSLQQIAADMGLEVERRPVAEEELSTFDEIGACGTAAVISPISKIVDRASGKEFAVGNGTEAGPVSTKLYKALRAIQEGEMEDKHNWNVLVD